VTQRTGENLENWLKPTISPICAPSHRHPPRKPAVTAGLTLPHSSGKAPAK
jgi:hypothetical protein